MANRGDGSLGAHGRHHFVPQFYLRNFSVSALERQVGLFQLSTGLYVPRASIRTQAQRDKLYGTGNRERLFSALEGIWSALIRQAVQSREVPKRFSGDHLALINFILFQAARTPTAATELNTAIQQFVVAIASFDMVMAPHIGQFEVRLNDPIGAALHHAATLHPIAMDLCYKLLINESPLPFLTSDHPVAFYNQFMERRSQFGSHTGLASKGLQVFVPLSDSTSLVLYDGDVYKVGGRRLKSVRVPVTADDVRYLNTLQAANAQEQLFFNDAMTEQEIRHTVMKAAQWRRAERSSIKSYSEGSRSDGTEAVLLHAHKVDLRIGLSLSPIVEVPDAASKPPDNAAAQVRNPKLCELHEAFLIEVDAKRYRASEFGRFLREQYARDYS